MKPLDNYPISEGWIYATLSLATKEQLSTEDLKQAATFGTADEYEFGPVMQRGKTAWVVSRHKSRIPSPKPA